ncbi:unnamed protein product, partial [Candidula unifasciata]
MNRRKVPPEMASVVHSGWMTKSPPERQLRLHFKIFHSHWKKRYFVLRKPTGSLPDQYELHYYKDQRCTNKKGSIDLDQCEQIIEALDSDVFPYLLAIKTSYKHKIRTYYLATDTEQDMNTWVKWLCHVCGLRPEDQPTDIPDLKPDQTAGAGAQRSGPMVVNGTTCSPHQQVKLSDSPMSTNPRVSAGHLARTHSRASTSSETSLGHFSPGNRLTGLQSVGRKTSVESTSESVAPPLPEKRHLLHNNGMTSVDDDVFIPSVYDHPPSRRSVDHPSVRGIMEHTSKHKESSSLYKVPPYLTTRDNKLSVGETSLADESTSLGRSPLTSLSSSLDSWTSCSIHGQAVTSTEGFDYPFSNHSLSVSTDNEIPPERPPKPHHLQSPYQNLPPTGKTSLFTDLNTVLAHPKSNQPNSGTGYDIPRSSQRSMQHHHQAELSHVPSAALRSGSQVSGNYSSHLYLNTMNKSGPGEHPGGSQGGSDEDYSVHSETGVAAPAVPPPRAGYPGESPAGNSGSLLLYQCPPSPSSASASASGNASRPGLRLLSQGPSVSSRVANGHSVGLNQEEASTGIFSTKRTRSFKSPYSLKSSVARHSPKVNSVSLSATIPAPRPLLPPRPKEMSTSEDDEEMRVHEPEEE